MLVHQPDKYVKTSPYYKVHFFQKNVTLQKERKAAINDLKLTMEGLQIAGVLTSFSLVVQMFFSRSVPTTAVNIAQNDWELFAESMASIPKIQRGYVVKVADHQILRHYKDSKQKAFWQGIKNGCTY